MRVPGYLLAATGLCVAACSGPSDLSSAHDHFRERSVLLGKADGPAVKKKWTFLYYGAGDNNLADDVFRDVNELEKVGSSADVNLVAFYDHATRGAFRAYLEADPDETAVASTQLALGEVDSGVAQTLVDFAAWAIPSYPADRYALVISGHGGGIPRVIAPDDKTESAMSLPDLLRAVHFIHERTNQPLSLFGGDACLMNTLETSVELADDVEVVVASENEEPASGWPYDRIVKAIERRPYWSAADVARMIVSEFGDKQKRESDVTLAAVSTRDARELAAAMSLLADELRPALEASPELLDKFGTLLGEVYRPENTAWSPDDETAPEPVPDEDVANDAEDPDGYVDLRMFLDAVTTQIGGDQVTYLATEARTILDRMVLRSYTAADYAGRANGVSIFFPLSAEDDAIADYGKTALATTTSWDDLVTWYLQLPTVDE